MASLLFWFHPKGEQSVNFFFGLEGKRKMARSIAVRKRGPRHFFMGKMRKFLPEGDSYLAQNVV